LGVVMVAMVPGQHLDERPAMAVFQTTV